MKLVRSQEKKQQKLPQHIAVIMDGNGRWAKKRLLPRIAGHKAGVKATRQLIENCARHKIKILTLFAFSSENWLRPADEVNALMELFCSHLDEELPSFQQHDIQMRFIGDFDKFPDKLQQQLNTAQQQTAANKGLILVVAASYGGRWDIVQAARCLASQVMQGKLQLDEINEANFSQAISLADLPTPDLFIRTSGEQRISNFFLWQLAYTELYFLDILWPDFSTIHFQQALDFFKQRVRRFGQVDEQIVAS